ncbi:MAG: heme ABC exporter ATP-binding protein CcmA [Chloroflexota bacterium]|nr:MAG: heme ABC exporter ATP-binding protein CcmA [Chloroflexota bacterium]
MTAPDAIIQTHALVKAFGLQPVLRRLDLSINRGDYVALLSPNGGGKSTLLRLLAGLSKPTSGRITVGGWELPAEAAAVRAQIGMVSHKVLLYENLSARENLRFFARLYNLPRAEAEARIETLLKRVGLARRQHDLVRTYSRGMQQRLSIARALLHDPHVLLFDEPYTGLDQDASRALDELLAEAHDEGHTIVMATHDLNRAATLASRVVILARGAVGFDRPSAELTPASLAAAYSEVTGMVTAR